MTHPLPPAPPAPVSGDDADAAAKRALAWTHTARFLTTASKLSELPVTELPEIAFVGRSNAGKSTAINVLTQQKRLAFASKTPGRTQHINLFELGPKAGARRPLRRPAGLRLRRRRAQRQAALAGGDGRVPRGAAQPERDRRPRRLAPRLHRDRPQAARFRRAAHGQRLGQAARVADQGRQAEPERDGGRATPRERGARGDDVGRGGCFAGGLLGAQPRRRRATRRASSIRMGARRDGRGIFRRRWPATPCRPGCPSRS